MGGVRKLLGLARGLQRAGHTVRVVVPRFLNLEDPRVEVVTYPTLSAWLVWPLSAYLAMVWIAWRQGRRVPPDLVYARTSRSVLPGLLARGLGARFVFEVNGDAFGEQGWRGGILRALTILAADWINCHLAGQVVAITPGLKAMVERRYRVSPAKVCLIPSGTDPQLIRPLVPVPPEDPEPLADEIVALLSDPRRRQILGEAGRRYVEAHHGWDLLAKQLLSHCGHVDGASLRSE